MAKKKDIETGTGKRAVQGTSAYALADAPSGKEFGKGTLRPKAGAGIGKADAMTAMHRGMTSPERMGPRFSIQPMMPGPQAPEAMLTQQNTRFMKSSINRSQPNFNLGMMG